MRIVYLSPHLDDAVISAGGWIRGRANAGLPVEIWTFMSGIPQGIEPPEFARLMHHIWGFPDGVEAVKARRVEDLNAAARVGATAVHFDFLDCIYRRGRQGEALYSDITLPIQPDDADLPAQLARVMAARIQPADMVMCQLGIGNHVDHVIVRKAAEMLHRPLVYVADVPYVLNHPRELEPNIVGLRETQEPVSEAEFECWIEAIECYKSQVDSVFGSHEEMHTRMREAWREHGGLRTWTIRASSVPAAESAAPPSTD